MRVWAIEKREQKEKWGRTRENKGVRENGGEQQQMRETEGE